LAPDQKVPEQSLKGGKMPKYFFDVNGNGVPDSEEGQMLTDDEGAWHEATLVAGEIFKDVDGNFRPGEQWKLVVQDEQRRPLFSIDVTSRRLR
jgi:hypothetical protein